MQNIIKFIVIFFLGTSLLGAYFYSLYDENKLLLKRVENKIDGVGYIGILYHLGIDVIHLKEARAKKSQDVLLIQEDMHDDIKSILLLQERKVHISLFFKE